MVTQNMSIKHEDEMTGRKALETLLRLVASADRDVRMRGQQLLQIITEKMSVDLRKYTEKFTKSTTNKKSVSEKSYMSIHFLFSTFQSCLADHLVAIFRTYHH